MYLEFPTKRKTSPETGNTTFSRYMAQSSINNAVINNRKKQIENFLLHYSFLDFSGFTQNKSSSVLNFMYTFFERYYFTITSKLLRQKSESLLHILL